MKKALNALFHSQGFVRHEGGAVAIIAAIALLALTIALGAGLDITRAHMVKSKLQTALDEAAIAAGATNDDADVEANARKYFLTNFPQGYQNTTVTGPTIQVNDEGKIYLEASARLPMIFMALIGKTSLEISAFSETTRTLRSLEIALVLDTTKSMLSNGKIGALRTAAKTLIDILYEGQASKPNIWISIVPFACSVNIGNTHTDWVNPAPLLTGTELPEYVSQYTTWKGCVIERDAPHDLSEANIETGGRFDRYIFPPVGVADREDPNRDCLSPILPLTNQVAELKAAIDTMELGGCTLNDVGLTWGWRTISPQWNGNRWSASLPASMPVEYGSKAVKKVIIIMTDGLNDLAYPWHPTDEVWTHVDPVTGKWVSPNPPFPEYSAYGDATRREARGLPASAATDASAFNYDPAQNRTASRAIDARVAPLCRAIKDKDVRVYTITFQLTRASQAPIRELFRQCASDVSYYFDSPTNNDLQKTFEAIANALVNLHLSK